MCFHGTNLAWNLVRCSPGNAKKMISGSQNDESRLFGAMSARIVPLLKQSGVGLQELQEIKPESVVELNKTREAYGMGRS